MAGAGHHAPLCGRRYRLGSRQATADFHRARQRVDPGAVGPRRSRTGPDLVGPAPDLVGLGGAGPDQHRARRRRAAAAALPRLQERSRLRPVRHVRHQAARASGRVPAGSERFRQRSDAVVQAPAVPQRAQRARAARRRRFGGRGPGVRVGASSGRVAASAQSRVHGGGTERCRQGTRPGPEDGRGPGRQFPASRAGRPRPGGRDRDRERDRGAVRGRGGGFET